MMAYNPNVDNMVSATVVASPVATGLATVAVTRHPPIEIYTNGSSKQGPLSEAELRSACAKAGLDSSQFLRIKAYLPYGSLR